MSTPKLTASYVTLAGAGFAEPPRFTFRQRCEAASAVGFARIGIHLNDLKTLKTMAKQKAGRVKIAKSLIVSPGVV